LHILKLFLLILKPKRAKSYHNETNQRQSPLICSICTPKQANRASAPMESRIFAIYQHPIETMENKLGGDHRPPILSSTTKIIRFIGKIVVAQNVPMQLVSLR